MTIEIDKVFRENFGLKENSYTFTTHSELDKFVIALESTDSEFKNKFKNDYNLLKSFDRAFWMRHYQFQCSNINEKTGFEPLESKIDTIDGTDAFDCLCPFHDPKETLSFLFK